MDDWLSVHSQAYSKVYLLYVLLVVLNLGGLIIFSIYYCKSKYSLEYLIEDDPDIYVAGLESFSFGAKSDIEYKEGVSNLGTTGKLYLKCYKGKCYYEKTYTCIKTRCYKVGDDEECEDYEDECTDSYSEIEHSCSNRCRRTGGSSCGIDYCYSSRTSFYYDYSKCSNDDDSKNTDYPKSCDAENLILYWGNLYYSRVNNTDYKTLTYLNSAVTANESCPLGKKMCGILDNLGNKLCYPSYLKCPLNYITTNRYDSNYTNFGSAYLQDKTVYFTNEATEDGRVIGGLFVDSDLLIKYNDEDCVKLEEKTVSQLLDSHRYKLYRNSLSYDPYTYKSAIVQNGKSYLKWCVPGVGKEKNISKIKELKVVFDFNVTTNKEVISPIKTFSTASYFVSLPGYIGLFFLLIVFIFSFFEQNDIHPYVGGFLRFSYSINCILFVIFVASSILVLVGTILAWVNIGNISAGNKLDLGTNVFGSLKILDIITICINMVLFLLIYIFSLYLFFTPKYVPVEESITQYKTYKDKTNYECTDFNNNNYNSSDFKNNNNTGYNSSDFNNNNNYYNSSDFNNNL